MLEALGGDRGKLVIDLSCRRTDGQRWHVAMNKWQKITDMEVNGGKLPAKNCPFPSSLWATYSNCT